MSSSWTILQTSSLSNFWKIGQFTLLKQQTTSLKTYHLTQIKQNRHSNRILTWSKHESKQWYLGIWLSLHSMNTIIAKCNFGDQSRKNNTFSHITYSLETPLIQFICFKRNDGLCIKYLNLMSKDSNQSSDGFVESSITGPDILSLLLKVESEL